MDNRVALGFLFFSHLILLDFQGKCQTSGLGELREALVYARHGRKI
jgi:hypothetical protein